MELGGCREERQREGCGRRKQKRGEGMQGMGEH